jgi:hypothetical protein
MDESKLSLEQQLSLATTRQRINDLPATGEVKDELREMIISLMLQTFALKDMLKQQWFNGGK